MTPRSVGAGVPKHRLPSVNSVIGGRVKLYRARAKVSQTALGRHLGVTFQQVQKYENGSNRISAASLVKIADFLNISINDLLVEEGQQRAKNSPLMRNEIIRFGKSREGQRLIKDFMAIDTPVLRRRIVDLINALQGRVLHAHQVTESKPPAMKEQTFLRKLKANNAKKPRS